MLCLRCSRGLSAFPGFSNSVKNISNAPLKRTFTSLTPLRPTILLPSRPSLSNLALSSTPETAGDIAILPFKPSTHPALASLQIRCAPRNTFNPSHFVRKRRHGFLSRIKTRTGKMIIKRRRAKGRKNLSH